MSRRSPLVAEPHIRRNRQRRFIMNLYRFTLNGKPVQARAEPDQSLLEVLRGQFKIISVKSACAPQGQCGACLALIDGVPRTSCSLAMSKIEGKEVLTLEGVST